MARGVGTRHRRDLTALLDTGQVAVRTPQRPAGLAKPVEFSRTAVVDTTKGRARSG